MSSIFKWRLTHKADTNLIKEALLGLGFERIPDHEHRFVLEVASHRQVKVGVSADEVLWYVYKEEEAATATYFEYMFEVGHLNGRLAEIIEQLPVRGGTDVEEGDEESLEEDLTPGIEE